MKNTLPCAHRLHGSPVGTPSTASHELSPAVLHLVTISADQLRDELPYYDGKEAIAILCESAGEIEGQADHVLERAHRLKVLARAGIIRARIAQLRQEAP